MVTPEEQARAAFDGSDVVCKNVALRKCHDTIVALRKELADTQAAVQNWRDARKALCDHYIHVGLKESSHHLWTALGEAEDRLRRSIDNK